MIFQEYLRGKKKKKEMAKQKGLINEIVYRNLP